MKKIIITTLLLLISIPLLSESHATYDLFKTGMKKAEAINLGKRKLQAYRKHDIVYKNNLGSRTRYEIKKYRTGIYRYILHFNKKEKLYKIEVHMNGTPESANRIQKNLYSSLSRYNKKNIDIKLQRINDAKKCEDIVSGTDFKTVKCSYDRKGNQRCTFSNGICRKFEIKNKRYIFLKKYRNAMIYLEVVDRTLQPKLKSVNVHFREFD